MKKFYKITIFFIILIILTTFNSKNLDLISKKKNGFFIVKNIKVVNNILINEKEIKDKLYYIYKKIFFF